MLGDCHADVKSYYCNAKLLLLYIIIYTHTHTAERAQDTAASVERELLCSVF